MSQTCVPCGGVVVQPNNQVIIKKIANPLDKLKEIPTITVKVTTNVQPKT